MEKKFESWKNSIRRSFGRKVGREFERELQNLPEAEQKQTPQQQQAQQPDQGQEQVQALQEAGDFPGPAKKKGPWKTLKRSLGRRLGSHDRPEMENAEEREKEEEEQQQQHGQGAEDLPAGSRPVPVMTMQEAIDAGLTFDEAIRFTAPAVLEDVQAGPPPTTVPPARYRVRRTRVAGDSEEQTRYSLRNRVPLGRVPEPDVAANAYKVAHHNAGTTPGTQPSSLGLGTTPTIPGYPHPLEVAAPVAKARRKFATWSERKKPFWSCCEHSNEISTDAAPSVPKPSRSRADVPAGASCQTSGGLRHTVQPPEMESAQRQRARGARKVAARLDDGFSWPSSSNPGLLEPVLFEPVPWVLNEDEARHVYGASEAVVARGEYVDEPGDAEDLPLTHSEERVEGTDTADAAVRDHGHAGEPQDECVGREESPGDLPAELTDGEVNMLQIRASIASLQQAVHSGVEEGDLEAIVEEEEEESLEGPQEEAALVRHALFDLVYSERRAAGTRGQRTASSTLLVSAESSEDLQAETSSAGTNGPDPGPWLKSKLPDVSVEFHGAAHRQLYPGETRGESAKASSRVPSPSCIRTTRSLPARSRSTARNEGTGREEPEPRAEKVRNWLVEREKRRKANEAASHASLFDETECTLNTSSPAPQTELSESASVDLGEGSAVAASPGEHVDSSPVLGPHLRICSSRQIARESTANHRDMVVIDGWTYPKRRQNEDQPLSQPYGNADADAGLATTEQDAEGLHGEPTNDEDMGESGSASTGISCDGYLAWANGMAR